MQLSACLRYSSVLFIFFLVFTAPGAAYADSFTFGNHIDSHQITQLRTVNGAPGKLRGVLLILFTGAVDPVSGLPVARHPRGAAAGEQCGVDVDCEAGWIVKARSGQAKFLYHTGVNGEDHAVWMVNRVQIPQPGGYTHFHWITSRSDDPRVGSVPLACEAETAGDLEGVAEDEICPGWFLEITAVQSFAFEHGNETVPVMPGRDNATHLNLVTNYAEVPLISGTR